MELMAHQKAGVDRSKASPRYGFFDDTGCHAAGTPILMYDGTILPIEKIKVGDKIMGPDSFSRTVTRLISGYGKMYKITPIKGSPFVVNEDHVLSLKKTTSPNKYPLIINISVREYLEQNKTFKHIYKLYRADQVLFKEKHQPLDPYFLGLYLGDGHCSHAGSVGVTTMDIEVVEETFKQAEKHGLKIRIDEHKNNRSNTYFITGGRGGNDRRNGLKEKLKELLLLGAAKDKHIPFIYKTGSIKQRMSLLAGLLDSDGEKSGNNSFTYTSKSERLAGDVAFVARSLGFAAYVHPHFVKKYPDNTYYKTLISGDTKILPTRIPHKKAKKRLQKKNVRVTGFSVAYAGVDNFYGFSITGDRLYLMGDFTVTHNTGKTCIGIHIIKEHNLKTLVVCPLSLIEVAWMDDFKKFAPELKPVNLWAAFQKRKTKSGAALVRQALEAPIGIINFEMFRLVMPDLLKAGYEMLIIDESSKLKCIKTSVTKKMIPFADCMKRVYIFSGTPAPNTKLEYWPQVRLLSKGVFGTSFYAWRNRYCYPSGYGGYEWKLKREYEQEFLDKLSTISRVVRKEDVLDLPERTENRREVILSTNERAAYDKMAKDLVYELEGIESVAANVAVKIMKLREATSGFLIGEGGQIIETGTSKLDALMELLEEIGDHQAIIWGQFRHEITKICDALGHNAHRVDGLVTNQATRIERVRDFMSGKTKYLVAHPQSLGHGVTLVNATYAIYTSLSYSWEQHSQSKDRIYRNGQRNACSYYYLCAKNSVDDVILKTLNQKHDSAEAVFKYLKYRSWVI